MPEPNDRNAYYKRIAEAALFVSGRALGVDELAKVLGVASIGHVKTIMDELVAEYQANGSPLNVTKIGERYVLGVKDAYVERVSSLAGAPDLSKGALRTLAYISKNEPIMQNSIVKAFGSSTYEYMKELTEKEFITTKRVGRTKSIETTSKFREYFNI